MKKYAKPALCVMLVFFVLSVHFLEKEPEFMMPLEDVLNEMPEQTIPDVETESENVTKGPLEEEPLQEPAEEPIEEPDPLPPEEPMPEEPQEEEPVEPTEPTDPFGLAYWLYHTEDRLFANDLELLNAQLRSGNAVCKIQEVDRYFTAAQIQKEISAYKLPEKGYDAQGNLLDDAFFLQALQLRALEQVTSVQASLALTVCKAELRAFPVQTPCYASNLMQDLFQEASLPAGTPLLLLHTSADGKYYFVKSYFYCGWVAVEDVCSTTEQLFSLFADPASFAVVYKPTSAHDLVMGTILPLVSQNDETVTLLVPDAECGTKPIELPLSDVSIGYLPATTHNLLKLAFSYVGTPYSWGDKGMGVDCSGLYVAVMRCMGIFMPRNTGDMRRAPEVSYVALDGTIPADLPTGSLIYRPGHVMMYLGTVEGQHYILHAPGSGMFVRVDILTRTDNLLVAFSPNV